MKKFKVGEVTEEWVGMFEQGIDAILKATGLQGKGLVDKLLAGLRLEEIQETKTDVPVEAVSDAIE